MRVLLIQENGRHEENRMFREALSMQRAFEKHGSNATVWGLNHPNYDEAPDFESYDLIINLENYDETGWVPSLSKVQTKKFLWSIDAHVKGIQPYLQTAHEGNYDLILQATPDFLNNNSVWFPSCYDDVLISPLSGDPTHDIGFCGNINNRDGLIDTLRNTFDKFKLDEFVIGDAMVRAINSYKVHFNANISIDINYRNFETLGCGTCLLTSHNPYYKNLGLEDGVNCLIYNSVEEMLDKASWAIDNDEPREKIAHNGLKLAKDHTYENRVGRILNQLDHAGEQQCI